MEYSFLTKSGMRRGDMRFTTLWKRLSRRSTLQERHGTGMPCI
jgi:hypothetical protein